MATELAKAYVQIIPSAQGIQGKITSAISGEASTAGREAGGILGKNLASTLKTTLVSLGIGSILKEAFSEGANLQQNLGGVETLFKDNADTVKKYAAEAYKTAGLSANEYMESVTSFSASLLQSLGGNTAKAAEAANMALIDMSDNANKMGTSMESIQNAYQGFAKQNYTMLDNLKLGYGGTKTEMERLLADAEKLSGVDYSIDNLNDVYEAIHVIQEDMGILGTTASESASTFTGSMAAMKASLSNVLAELTLGHDVTPALQSLVDTVMVFCKDNLFPMAWNIISGIGEVLGEAAMQILGADTSIVFSIIESITSKIPELLSKGTEIVISILTGIMENLPFIWQAGVDLILSLVTGIIENLPAIMDAVIQVVAQFIATIGENLPEILESGIEILAELAAGIIEGIGKVIAVIPEVFQSIKNEFANKDWLSIGADIIEGIKNGISNGIERIKEAAKNAAKGALEAAKAALGIQSPSKEFYKIGEFVTMGFAKGIDSKTRLVTDSLNKIADESINGFQSDVSMTSSMSSGIGNVDMNANMSSRMDVLIAMLYQYLPECAKPTTIDGESIMETLNRELGMAVI